MKKTAIIAGAVFFCFLTATVSAQQTEPQTQTPAPTSTTVAPQPTMTTTVAPATITTTTAVSTDKWNNYDRAKYAMLPMPQPLTMDKIFPAVGQYNLTTKDGAASQVTLTLDESNKGIVWIDGLPQGKIHADLRQSPAVYKIPAQQTADQKEFPGGVLIYDKDANTMNICTGCTYNVQDPASVFLPAATTTTVDAVPAKSKTKSKAAKTKVVKVKPVYYTGSKTIVETSVPATVAPAATVPATTPVQ